MFIVIDDATLLLMAVTTSRMEAEDWCHLPSNHGRDLVVLGDSGRDYSKYTHLELKALYHNLTGAIVPDSLTYPELIAGVRQLPSTFTKTEKDLESPCVGTKNDGQFKSRRESPNISNKEDIMSKEKKAVEKTEKEQKKAPVAKVEQNGVIRPKDGTKTGRVWAIADEVSASLKAPAGRKAVIDAATGEGINAATAATQYGRWRKFNGLEGRGAEAATEE